MSKTWNRSWCIHIVPLQANSYPKTKFEKVYLWISLFFLANHRDELIRRYKMRLKKWFLLLRMTFIGFPDILGGNRVKLPELGIRRIELGRACIRYTQNLRKSIYAAWVMNKSICERFIDGMRKWSTFTSHTQPFPKISLKFWVFGPRAYIWVCSPLEL